MSFPAHPSTRMLTVAAVLMLSACAPSTSPAPPAGNTRAASEASVRTSVDAFKEAIRIRDVDKVLSFYAADGWQLAQNGAIARTPEERRSYWKAIEALPIAQDIVDVADRIEVAQSGDLAIQYGEFRQVTIDKKGALTSVPQKFMNSWRRQADGSWKVSASIASVAN